MSTMDYYIADRHYVPRDQIEGQFTEQIAYLPAYAPFQPFDFAPGLNALPAAKNGHITFGSFNRYNKLRPRTIALWSELLRALPDARMMVAGVPRDDSYLDIVRWFESEGVDASRLEFRERANIRTYLSHHLDVDIALDTFPYAGGVTTLQSLWMGVPTLVMPGEMIASRGSTSGMSNVGLDSFVAQDHADFVAKGVAWSNKLGELAQIRETMRERCLRSPAFEKDTVAIAFAKAVRTMWQKWCAGEKAATFEV
jgi:predicted O-linked N-acetylglucosamine transferase (SPINDLY family)